MNPAHQISAREDVQDPVYQAYRILHIGFTVAPILAGLDKFTNLLVDWTQYLAPFIANIVPASTFMGIVGLVEIIAGLLVFFKPRIGAYVVAAWLAGIIFHLLLVLSRRRPARPRSLPRRSGSGPSEHRLWRLKPQEEHR